MEIKGIDVSAWNGNIDWKTVANYGMDFAILRITEKGNAVDSTFERNYKGCKENRIPVGVYKYSYAKNAAQAEEEAEKVLKVLNKRTLDFPVFYDLEWNDQRALGGAAIEKIALAFLKKIKAAGYPVGIYSNADWYENVLTPELKEYDCWIARYPANDDGWLQERLRPAYGVGWQYSSKATIPGIPTKVDRNVFYKDYKAEDKEENTMNKLQEFIDLGNYYANNGGSKPYLEKKSNAYLDDFTANAGYNNYTKFARDVNNWNQPGCQGQPWCAVYQFWKLVKTFGLTKALQIMGGGFYNCQSVINHAKTKGTWKKTPKKGALILFRNGSHIGSVNSYDTTYVYSNEGNTSSAAGVVANGGSVRNKSYKLNDPNIDGYVWINWDENADQTVTETAAKLNTKPRWVGEVTTTELNVRSWAGTENPTIKKWPKLIKENLIDVCDTIKDRKGADWYYIRIAAKYYGFVHSSYVKRR